MQAGGGLLGEMNGIANLTIFFFISCTLLNDNIGYFMYFLETASLSS